MSVTDTVKAIQEGNARVYVIATGAGAGIQSLLWETPGISANLVGASFPYATEATEDTLGFAPEQYCSPKTALALAQEAYMRAWTAGTEHAIGVGLTASVASSREHRGEHRVHIGVVSVHESRVVTAYIEKGVGPTRRKIDDEICNTLALDAISWAANRTHSMTSETQDLMRHHGLKSIMDSPEGDLALETFFEHPLFKSDGTRGPAPESGEDLHLFPGAFNPPHEGHFGIASSMGVPVTFEISADSPHKPSLSLVDLLQRAKLLRGQTRLFTKGCPLYIHKALRFPGSGLIVGADALARIYDKKWCANPADLTRSFNAQKITFWVFGREIGGKFTTVVDLMKANPTMLGLNCTAVPGRWDVSSTQIRQQKSA